MAFIKCVECGREISDRAASCPGCGCPLQRQKAEGIMVAFPIFMGLKPACFVLDSSGKELVRCKMGDTVYVPLRQPQTIVIKISYRKASIYAQPGRGYKVEVNRFWGTVSASECEPLALQTQAVSQPPSMTETPSVAEPSPAPLPGQARQAERFCSYCGAKANVEHIFCISCGHRL